MYYIIVILLLNFVEKAVTYLIPIYTKSGVGHLLQTTVSHNSIVRRIVFDKCVPCYAFIKFCFLFYVGDKFEAVVPFMGESVTDGTLANFLKSMLPLSLSLSLSLSPCDNIFFFLYTEPGDRVEADEPIAQIETDKVLEASV